MFIEQMPDIVRLLYPTVLWRKDKDKKVIYLTFDDGPTEEITHWILKTLDEFGVKATFFCIGNRNFRHFCTFGVGTDYTSSVFIVAE